MGVSHMLVTYSYAVFSCVTESEVLTPLFVWATLACKGCIVLYTSFATMYYIAALRSVKMTREDTRIYVLNLVRTGLSVEKALLLAEVDDFEAERIKNDPKFSRQVAAEQAKAEKQLLDRLESIIETNEARGISTEVRWKLERLNPKMWSAKQQAPVEDSGVLPALVVQ